MVALGSGQEGFTVKTGEQVVVADVPVFGSCEQMAHAK